MPIYPFVLWSTNDMKSGNLYLKIDRRTIHIASYNKTTSPENPVVKAVCVAIMAAHVFNLDYHPYLRHVFNYLELLKCVNHAPAASVSSFASAIRELQKP